MCYIAGQVFISPENDTVKVNATVSFECRTQYCSNLTVMNRVWLINGKNSIDNTRFNVYDNGTSFLTFSAYLEDNGTRIVCQLILSNNSTKNSSAAVLTVTNGK